MRAVKTQERKELNERRETEADAMLHPNYFLMGTALPNITAKKLLHFWCMKDRKMHSQLDRETQKKFAIPLWKPCCYISCYATQQPAKQSAVPVWGERSSTSASSARWTINWPYVTAAPLSPVCFWAFPDFPCFHIPLCHFPSHQLSDKKRSVLWVPIDATGVHVVCEFFVWVPLSDQFVDVSFTFQPWLFACSFQYLLLFLFKFSLKSEEMHFGAFILRVRIRTFLETFYYVIYSWQW